MRCMMRRRRYSISIGYRFSAFLPSFVFHWRTARGGCGILVFFCIARCLSSGWRRCTLQVYFTHSAQFTWCTYSTNFALTLLLPLLQVFQLWLTLARHLSLSYGETEATKERYSWNTCSKGSSKVSAKYEWRDWSNQREVYPDPKP